MPGRRLFVDISPLRESRDFRLLWLSELATWSGRQIVIVAVPYQIYVLTHSSLAVGLVGLAEVVPIVIAGVYGGVLADRFDRRYVQLIAKTVVAAGAVILVLGAIGLRASQGQLYGVVAVIAAAWTVDQSARSATVPRVVPGHLLPSALSLGQASFQTASIAGPAVAGLVIATAGLSWAYALDAIAYVPAAVLVWQVSPQRVANDNDVVLGWRAPAEAIRYVRRRPLLISLFAADLVAMIFGMPTAVFPALALGVFQINATGLGLLYAAPGFGAILAAVLSGWIPRVRRQGTAIVVAIVIWGLAIALFGLFGEALWIGLPLLALAGAANNIGAIFRHTILQLSVPDSMRGRISALNLLVAFSGPRLGDAEAGAVASLVSPVFSVVSGGIASVVGISLLAALMPALRRQRAAGKAAGALWPPTG